MRYVEPLSEVRTKLADLRPSSEGTQDVRKRPFSAAAVRERREAYPCGTLTGLTDTRTKLMAFFNILQLPPSPFARKKHMNPEREIGHGVGQYARPESFGVVEYPRVGHACQHAGQP